LKVSIILPTYNERGNIRDLITAIGEALKPEPWEQEIIVVDDNSPDGTADVVRSQPVEPPLEMKCFVRTEERGLATAIKFGIEHADGDIVVVMDTDFNHDPAMIPQMVKFLEFYDMVIGSRFVMGGGMEDRQRYNYSFFYNLFVRMVLRRNYHMLEVPVFYILRRHGKSKSRFVAMLREYTSCVISLRLHQR
jgi:dolichol-phosphate mannosyltransferase